MRINFSELQTIQVHSVEKEKLMKATGIVRRIDDLGRVVIPKEIRRTMRIREGDPLQIIRTSTELFCYGLLQLEKRIHKMG